MKIEKSIFVKYRYCDHGCSDTMKEVEIPEWALHEYSTEEESIVSYLCDKENLPTWSERFLPSRVKWEKVNKTPAQMQEIYKKKIDGLRVSIRRLQDEMNELKKLLIDK